MQHHAIIVTSFDDKILKKAHQVASGLMPHVSGIVTGTINSQLSFAVLPDGSKEGWPESDYANAARKALKYWIDCHAYEDGSNRLEYAEVSFGELPLTVTTNQVTKHH